MAATPEQDKRAKGQGTVTITFGETAENHVGMQKLGSGPGSISEGFTLAELQQAQVALETRGVLCELVDLVALLPEELRPQAAPAWVLVARQAVQTLLADQGGADGLYTEIIQFPHDKQYFDARRKTVLNKQARWNLCISETSQEAALESGRGTVLAFSEVPRVSLIRDTLPDLLGPKAAGLVAETNYYFDTSKCGIGFHGDAERCLVVGVRVGESLPLHYQWYHRFERVGERARLILHHGDLYVMSAKAVGTDWKRSSILTLRHAAGAPKYLK